MDDERQDRQLEGRHTAFPMRQVKVAEADPQTGKRQIEGYASVFGNRDAYGDVIVPGAFERTLTERPDVKVLWQHFTDEPIGKQIDGYEDEFGLKVRGELSNIPKVRDEVVPLLLDEVVTGLSIGYNVVEEEFNPELRTWFLLDLELFEWSPVTFPANELATVTQVKGTDLGRQPVPTSRRAAVRADSLHAHARSLIHGLDGYFAKGDRRGALDLDLLAQAHALLGGALPGGASQAADAGDVEQQIAEAYLQGGLDAIGELQNGLTPATKE